MFIVWIYSFLTFIFDKFNGVCLNKGLTDSNILKKNGKKGESGWGIFKTWKHRVSRYLFGASMIDYKLIIKNQFILRKYKIAVTFILNFWFWFDKESMTAKEKLYYT